MELNGLRIGMVGPLPPPSGGMANQTRQLTELLQSAGALVHMVQTNAPYRPAWVQKLPVVRALFRLLPYVWSLWRATGRSDLMHVMANSGWSWHLFATPAIWIARVRGVPVIVNYRGGEARQFLANAQGVVRFTMRQVSNLVVPSAFLQEVFSDFGMQSTIVPNIVDLSRFRARKTRSVGAPHMMVARNLEPLYDNATALHAFKIVRDQFADARLTIAGSGPEASRLEGLASELGIGASVRFVGRLERDAMAVLYRTADLTINPSLADNMPNSILESLASGVPVVSTSVGGVPFMVQDEKTALLVSPADPPQMAAACIRLLRDDTLWLRLSKAGLAEVQRYTWERVRPQLVVLYRKAVAGR
jgi:glycosyltransferase involved in cell wall biosynthesis